LKKGVKHIKLLLEKGKEYEKRKEELSKAKETATDPELTQKPKINYTATSA